MRIVVLKNKINFRKVSGAKELLDRKIEIFSVVISILIYGDSKARL